VLSIKPPSRFGDARTIVDRVLASGKAWVAVAKYEGADVIRACVTHGETTPEDVYELVVALQNAGEANERIRLADGSGVTFQRGTKNSR
jgi:hypothetical protein